MSASTTTSPHLPAIETFKQALGRAWVWISLAASAFGDGLHASRRYHQLTMRGVPASVATRRVFQDLYVDRPNGR